MATAARPTLWHIPISHYNEKARWALEYKGVEHQRKAPTPPAHMLVSLALTRGRHFTFPVLGVNGSSIGDSTAIIAWLEEHHPEPALYPADPDERRRALALEDWFDEELGPQMRLLGFHEVTNDPRVLEEVAALILPSAIARFRGPAAAGVRTLLNLRFGVGSEERADRARAAVVGALDRIESELGDREYLAGDGFSVADLTAAALLYPLVLPPEGPQLPAPSEAYEAFRAPLKDRRGFRWVAEMFRRHRRPLR
jgi:glutathione S-transferase